MASASGVGVWRLPAPAAMVVAFGMFFLPWMEVTCSAPAGGLGELGEGLGAPKTAKAKSDKGGGGMVLFTQTGWQALTGDFSPGEFFKQMAPKEEQAKFSKPESRPPAATRLYPVVILLGLGIFVGAAMPAGAVRIGLLLICVLGAGGCLGWAATGPFPLMEMPNKGGGAGGMGPDVMFAANFTTGFWATCAAIGVAALFVFAELAVNGTGNSAPARSTAPAQNF